MTEDREQSPAPAREPTSPGAPAQGTAGPPPRGPHPFCTGAFGFAVLALLLYALMADAAVETALSGSPVRWIVAGTVAGYLALSSVLWRRFPWVTKAAASLLVLLGLLAATAWLRDGLNHGVNLLRQPTSTVLEGVTFLAILLAGVLVMRRRSAPLPARFAAGLVTAYGLAATGLAIATRLSYVDLLHGKSLWDRLPFWLQGGFVGALVFVPVALLVHLGYGALRFRGPRLRMWAVEVLVLSLGVAVAAAGFMGPAGPAHVAVAPPPSPPNPPAQRSQSPEPTPQQPGAPSQPARPSQPSQPTPQSAGEQASGGGTQPAVPEPTPTQPKPQVQRPQPTPPAPSQPQAAQSQPSPGLTPPVQPLGAGPAQPTSPQAAPGQPQAPAVPPASPGPTGETQTGTLHFTTFGTCRDAANGKKANVYRVAFTYVVRSEFSLRTPEGIVCTNDDVDGLIFAPDGDLLVSAKGDGVHKVNAQTGAFSTIKLTVPAFHIMLDPSGTKVWVSSIPGTPATIPFPVSGKSTVHVLTGDDGALTTIAWADARNAYYTSSGPFGGGNFGRLDLTTLTTKRILSGLAAAHGMVFDPYTRSLMLMGANHVTQISVGATPAIVSDWTAPIDPLDQGAVDGKGHLFVACNCGRMLFIDYSASRKIGNPENFTATVQLVEALDDIAPLVGPGGESAVSPKNVLVTEEQGRIRIVLEAEILFDLDKSNLKPSAEAALARIKASIIDKYPGARLIIEGHTDDHGSQEYNRTLSTRRAQSVAAWLSRHGIAGSRLQTVGYGKTKPRVPNTSEENRARNRRVEIVVVK